MLNIQNTQNYAGLNQNQNRCANPSFGRYYKLTKQGVNSLENLPEAIANSFTRALRIYRNNTAFNTIEKESSIPVDAVLVTEEIKKRSLIRRFFDFLTDTPKPLAKSNISVVSSGQKYTVAQIEHKEENPTYFGLYSIAISKIPLGLKNLEKKLFPATEQQEKQLAQKYIIAKAKKAGVAQ